MANQIFMRVNEVAEELGVSVPYAYKLIRQMNEELAKTGCITISGRIEAGQDVNDELLDTIRMIATIMNGMQEDFAYDR